MKKIESVLSHKRLQNAQPESKDSDQNDRAWENPNEQNFAFLDRKALPRKVRKSGKMSPFCDINKLTDNAYKGIIFLYGFGIDIRILN